MFKILCNFLGMICAVGVLTAQEFSTSDHSLSEMTYENTAASSSYFKDIPAISYKDTDSLGEPSHRAQRRQSRQLKRKALKLKLSDPLTPTRAAFYSAIVPGLGQAYTRKYWKIPIVYASLVTGVSVAVWNQNKYDELRDIYKNRLLGIYTDKYYDAEAGVEIISTEALVSAQKNYKQQKELSILITVGLYILNIIDANVTAHLINYNVSEDLSIKPHYEFKDQGVWSRSRGTYGLQMSYQF